MVDRIRYPTVSYLPFHYIFFDFRFLLLTIFNLQAKILTIKDILSNLDRRRTVAADRPTAALLPTDPPPATTDNFTN